MTPYYAAGGVTIYHADFRSLLAVLPVPHCILADPPYGQTSLDWDRWIPDWPRAARAFAGRRPVSMWCFGSFRMFFEHASEFRDWRLAQDIVWEKHNGSGLHNDRFRRVHEHPVQFFAGKWGSVYKCPQFTADATARTIRRKARPAHWGKLAHDQRDNYTTVDGGPRLMRSVIRVRSMHGRARNPTHKPPGILEPLIRYSVPPDGLLLDLFMGSGEALLVAARLGMRGIGVDVRESECESAATALSACREVAV